MKPDKATGYKHFGHAILCAVAGLFAAFVPPDTLLTSAVSALLGVSGLVLLLMSWRHLRHF